MVGDSWFVDKSEKTGLTGFDTKSLLKNKLNTILRHSVLFNVGAPNHNRSHPCWEIARRVGRVPHKEREAMRH